MELRHLRYFVAVAEEENITRAAERLNVSQPPLSRQIRDLEDELGMELFTREARRIRLTDAGRIFLQEVRACLSRIDEAIEVTRMASQGLHGEIHVGYAPSLTAELLPKILKRFQVTTPRVKVRLHDLTTMKMLQGLKDHSLHAAFMVENTKRVMKDLHFYPLQSHDVCLALDSGHPLARRRKISLGEVAQEKLIALTLADYPEYHAWIAGLLGTTTPPIAAEHDSITSLMAAVESGQGLALVARGLECLSGPRLKITPLTPPPKPLVLGIATHQDDASLLTKNFVSTSLQFHRALDGMPLA